LEGGFGADDAVVGVLVEEAGPDLVERGWMALICLRISMQ
jgi:hypothetical protein